MIFEEEELDWYAKYMYDCRDLIWKSQYIKSRDKVDKSDIDIDNIEKNGDGWRVHWSIEIVENGKPQIELGMMKIPSYQEWRQEIIARRRDERLKQLGI